MPIAHHKRRVLLCPRGHLAYGQDFQNAGLEEHCRLMSLTKSEGGYRWPYSDRPELVISQNPDDADDANFIAGLDDTTASVVHVHCRWEYFDEKQKKVAEKALNNATFGIVPAEFHKTEMEKHFPNLIWHVASNGVRPDLFRPAKQHERNEFKIAHLLSTDTKLVGYTDRIESSKAIEILREICRRIANEPFALLVQ